ncbi:hypothetical protein RN001_013216 [Aquatica leii]|uniref:Alpha 1,4-glycosyltransferase domain-containing protein n=1 Tax=Aquatica leii TaxID=1421715 RepID=A0AAN7S6W5_9COLE|nr:hypothetical protein RN001_013216 [Aquatica leii]
MKLAVFLGLFSCLQLALAASSCPDCEETSSVYDIWGCNGVCKQGSCITTYSCNKVIYRYRAVRRKCYFNGNYYDIGFILPRKYPSADGRFLCDYICSQVGNYYYFLPINCVRIVVIPVPGLCIGTVQLYGPYILYNNYGIIYRPAVCQIIVIKHEGLVIPPSNCVGQIRKCCRFGNRFYRKVCVLFLKNTKTISKANLIACYRFKERSLPDIYEVNPKKDKSIFFHETSCNSYMEGKITIEPRQACAVESAALLHPDHDVYLLFASPGIIKYKDTESDRVLKALLTYNNININHLDYEKYTKGTPVENLYRDGKIEASTYALSHASDVLRYLTLWKYGGVYLDLDVIVIKPLSTLPPNYVGLQSGISVAAGVMSFSATGSGHKFAEMCLDDLKKNFRGKEWAYNGPGTMQRTDSIACYRFKERSLPDISELNPKKGKSIFFHETSCNSYIEGKITIQPRQACAVESAALMNPNYDVYLLFTSPGVIKYEDTESDRILKALLTYNNININHLDYEKYTKDTPVEILYRDGKVEASVYARSHASDVLRYLTLWKYGGIYLDLDVIVIKSLSTLPPNYSGSESDKNVAAGVMGFSANGSGHNFAKMCLDDLKKNFRGNDWGYNGPGTITRLLRKLCGVTNAKDMLTKDCQGFKVYPPESFYPVPWRDWHMYFDSKNNYKMCNITKNSYAIHVWNKHSVNTKIKVDTEVPYTLFAKEFCPKVFAECKESF